MNEQANDNETTVQLIERWRAARLHEADADAARQEAYRRWEEATAGRCAAERTLYARLEAEQGQEPKARHHRGCAVWAEAGRVRVLRIAEDQG